MRSDSRYPVSTCAPGFRGLTLDRAELQPGGKKSANSRGSLRLQLTFEINFREVMYKAARSLCIMRRVRELFDCSRVLKNCFNVYVLASLKYCGCRLKSLIWVCWIVLFAVLEGCVRMNFSFGAQKEGRCLVLAV